MTLAEQYARAICSFRGADPDAPLTMGYPDGTMAQFDEAWRGYAPLAEQLLEMKENQDG